MRKILFVSIAILTSQLLFAQVKSASEKRLAAFKTPPDSVKPSVYWYWVSDNISVKGVTKDIEAMSKVGIGRAFIGNVGLGEPVGKARLFSDEWWKVTEVALATATKHEVDIGMFNGPGWSQSGGPWIKPSASMRYLGSQQWEVKGPQQLNMNVSITTPNFQSVAVMAYKKNVAGNDKLASHSPTITASQNIASLNNLIDGDTATVALFPEGAKEFTIDISLANSFTARSINLYTVQQPFSATVALQIKEGDNYKTVRQFDIDRTNPDKNVGFIPFATIAIAFPATAAQQFRLAFTNVNGKSGIAEIVLSPTPIVERYMEKQLAKMFQTPLPLWEEYQWAPQADAAQKEFAVDPATIKNITANMQPDGTLKWEVPEGDWVITHYGMLPTGVPNAPATPEGQGLEADKINKDVLQNHFDSFVGKVQKRIKPADSKSLKWIVADSYETGSLNWTDGMSEAFSKKYGYNPLPWLPVLNGTVVGSANQSDRFLWDLRRMVADRVSYEYVGGLREIAHKNNLKVWLENYGHWGFPGEFLQYGGQSDEVGGEFWNEGSLGNIENRAASSSAHIYGKTKVAAESFTSGGSAYARYPAMLKRRGDWAFTEGINNTLLHVFIEQPYDSLPGVNAWFGTEFNRNNTWFYQGKAFVDYIRRCNYMLQQGKPVSDVAYFIGEDAPKMTGTRQPELPVGYQFDYINAEVILTRLSVKNGRLVLPDGVSYACMVLPPLETMRPELLRKISQLVNDGAVIVGPVPKRSPSMQNYPSADNEVQQLATQLWKNVDGKNTTSARVGKGMIINGITMQQTLKMLKVPADFKSNSTDPVLFIHRSTADEEIYFVTNQSDKAITFNPEFRVTGKQPEWWDAVSGNNRVLPVFSTSENVTTVPVSLQPYESGFMVFKKSATKKGAGVNFPEPVLLQSIATPWSVKFDAKMRGPVKPVVFNQLEDWISNSNDSIKNYSGTAIYTAGFTIKTLTKGEAVFIDLGNVKVMANVKLNGKDLGTVWTAPWRVNASSALKVGFNQLEIEVVNTWENRLIGDSKLPEAERKTWTNVNTFTPTSPYQSSGLMGPVTLQSVKY
jgi:hypothetical protein